LKKNSAGVYEAGIFSGISWLRHGFGSLASEGWTGPYTMAKQVHSDTVLVANGLTGSIGEADALITSEPGQLVGIRTADCLPILLVDPVHRVVAAIHAGWRGTVAGITATTVTRMRQQFGSDSADLLAAIGPGIGLCCFEVGPEVGRQFQSTFPERAELGHVDLREAIRRQLIDTGVNMRSVETADLCTVCTAGEFHSFRRDKEASGRMVSAIGVL
jgi:YfiH family protein